MKRLFDIISSSFGIILLFPLLLFVFVAVVVDSKGGGFYRQVRVGRNNIDFRLWKFRTMRTDADKLGLLTVGGRDPRVTRVGYFLRKYKLDELPQLFNILSGDMSVVGPRPEVRRYVDMYNDEQMKVLNVRPGLTDYASIEYFDENTLLAQSEDPERTYIEEVMPHKLSLNLQYIEEQSVAVDFKIIFKTASKILH
jgi:lipopolysaccharide/colanic/teichoic acid biosynthesis glycosyltransferase